MNGERIFVYGSLKPGGWAHKRIEGKVENPRNATLPGVLYNVGGNYPALRLPPQRDMRYPLVVHGVLYDIVDGVTSADLIEDLDNLEGYPNLFDRDVFEVKTSEGAFNALVYFGKNERLFDGNVISNGIWEV